jgi:hypothetical protein
MRSPRCRRCSLEIRSQARSPISFSTSPRSYTTRSLTCSCRLMSFAPFNPRGSRGRSRRRAMAGLTGTPSTWFAMPSGRS